MNPLRVSSVTSGFFCSYLASPSFQTQFGGTVALRDHCVSAFIESKKRVSPDQRPFPNRSTPNLARMPSQGGIINGKVVPLTSQLSARCFFSQLTPDPDIKTRKPTSEHSKGVRGAASTHGPLGTGDSQSSSGLGRL